MKNGIYFYYKKFIILGGVLLPNKLLEELIMQLKIIGIVLWKKKSNSISKNLKILQIKLLMEIIILKSLVKLKKNVFKIF